VLEKLLADATATFEAGLWTLHGAVEDESDDEIGFGFPGGILQLDDTKKTLELTEGRWAELNVELTKCVKEATQVAGLAGHGAFDAPFLERTHPSQYDRVHISNIYSPPKQNMVHIDWGSLVANVHLTSNFDDSSTGFFKAGEAYGVLTDAEHAIQASVLPLEAFPEVPGVDISRIARYVAEFKSDGNTNETPAGDELGFYGAHDPMGVFEHVDALPLRMNQLAVYSGHTYHTAVVDEAAGLRVDPHPARGRLTLQMFLESPYLHTIAAVAQEFEDYEVPDGETPHSHLMSELFGKRPERCPYKVEKLKQDRACRAAFNSVCNLCGTTRAECEACLQSSSGSFADSCPDTRLPRSLCTKAGKRLDSLVCKKEL
jgi:hypothetical protein